MQAGRWTGLVAVAATLLGGSTVAAASSTAAPAGARAGSFRIARTGSVGDVERALQAASSGRVQIRRDDDGRTHFIGTSAGRPVRRPAGLPADVSPEVAARAYLGRYGALFGLSDQVHQLRTVRVVGGARGENLVRFRQTSSGIPVYGGELVSALDSRGNLLSISGETSRSVLSSAFSVTPGAAGRAAVAATARAHHLATRDLRATRPTRWLFDPSLLTPGSPSGARSVWRFEVTSPLTPDLRELVLVDASTGWVSLRFNQVARASSRVVCDDGNRVSNAYACHRGRYVSSPSSSGIRDVRDAFARAGDAVSWYRNRLGVNLIALIGSDLGDGKKLRSTTRVCLRGDTCPMFNAFWDGSQMAYGQSLPRADDVVAHEMTHGVTQHTSELAYWFQSGAINESMSDVFGELVDQARNGAGTDTTASRWQLGEDLPGPVIRDMQRPAAHQQPDRISDSLYYDDAPTGDDNGGVHTNSGVGNKAAYLIVDGTDGEPGGVFNGQDIAGIGAAKAAHVYWAAEQMLTPGADYADLASVLSQACTNLAAAGTAGVTTADCGEVAKAVLATEMADDRPGQQAPGVPTGLRVTGGDGKVNLRWAAPTTGGPFNSYLLSVHPAISSIGSSVPLDRSTTGGDLLGFRSGRTYTIRLSAVSSSGNSAEVTRRLRGTAVSGSAPASVVRGSAAKVRGRLTQVTPAAPLAGRKVRLLRRYAGASSYSLVATDATTANGSYSFRPKPSRTASFRVSFRSGSTVRMGAHSSVRTVAVRQKVTLSLSDSSVRRGSPVRFTGRVTPGHSGATVRLQRRSPRGWTTVKTGTLSAGSHYAISLRPGSRRDHRWRTLVKARPRRALVAGHSPTRLLKVR